jgi:predicted RNA-binding Zn ribbon-like protein
VPARLATPIILTATAREAACLDFVNTCMLRGTAAPVEQFGTPTDVLDWVGGTTGLSGATLVALHAWSAAHDDQAATVFTAAIALRELLYRVFSAVAAGSSVSEPDLTALNRALAGAPRRTSLERLPGATHHGAYAWRVELAALSAPALLAPILWSAAELLVQLPYRRIRQCANPQCLWLFIDASKTGTRRWCDMTACGNRAKARRHYLKSRQR